ncbi:MAG: hypothetical protein PHE49_10005 [bacterium]|nr:hypothetical protein [bacterium]
MRKYIGLILIITASQALAWHQPTGQLVTGKTHKKNTGIKGSKSEVSSQPADFWKVYWTGVGNLTDWTVSNTLQGGLFGRPYTDAIGKYDASDAQHNRAQSWFNIAATRGRTGEYPAGSYQYYTYECGLWVGAKRRFPGDTSWTRVLARGAYSSDVGAMCVPELEDAGEAGNIAAKGLAFSDQILPSGGGYPHAGSFVFKQSGLDKESYQALWPFADTLINKRRSDPTLYLNPANGDIVSQEDVFSVAGDWIPAEDATVIWVADAGPYDGAKGAVGVRIEQRTYSWNYAYNESYIYLNWKIRNMTEDTLKDVYLGYFMDNDIGQSSNDPASGCKDELIGYDTSYVSEFGRRMDLGYTYDIDGKEPGWTTPAGYVGCVMCETPGNKGMTGFQYWQIVGEPGNTIDQPLQDSVKYEVLSCNFPGRPAYMSATVPEDMRQLSCSGPTATLAPGQEIEMTVAVVSAYTLGDLRTRAMNAIRQFNMGYIGFAPPPAPALSIIPGDEKVYLSWSSLPESYIDPMAKVPTFEGYRVYKSETGLSDAWTLLTSYDLKSNSEDTVLVGYTQGHSKARITFEGYSTGADTIYYKDCRYKITFQNQYQFGVMDMDSGKGYYYNNRADTAGAGYYCVTDSNKTPYAVDPGYVSGGYIYIDGFYVKIKNGTAPEEPGADLHPVSGDEFTIWTYKSKPVGSESGIQHCYTDEEVNNGKKYYYSVSSYNKPIPEMGLDSLESAKTGKKYWAIPMETPANYQGAKVSVYHTKGLGDASIVVSIARPDTVTGHGYRITFLKDMIDTMKAKYWRLEDTTEHTVLLDSCEYFQLDSLPLFDGLDIKISKTISDSTIADAARINSTKSGWSDTTNSGTYKQKNKRSNFAFTPKFNLTPSISVREPYYDYKITVCKVGGTDTVPFKIVNMNYPDSAVLFWYTDKIPMDTLSNSDMITIFKNQADYQAKKYSISLTVDTTQVGDVGKSIKPDTGDVYKLTVLNRVTVRDTFYIMTTAFNAEKECELDSIRVMPNPYFMRATWDKSKYQHKIWFQGIPSKCTIRIFTVAGLLVKTIEHDESTFSGMSTRTEVSGPGAHAWDFTSKAIKEGETGPIVASGLYIYQVTAKDKYDNKIQKIGKFVIIK